MPKYTIALSDEVVASAKIAQSIVGNPYLNRFIALAVEKYAEQVIAEFKSEPKQVPVGAVGSGQPGDPSCPYPSSPYDELAEPLMLAGAPPAPTLTAEQEEIVQAVSWCLSENRLRADDRHIGHRIIEDLGAGRQVWQGYEQAVAEMVKAFRLRLPSSGTKVDPLPEG